MYAGPEFEMNFRFSIFLNIIFITLLYGTALPILYPIALWSFIVLYITERLCVCYYYKQPPAYDEKMTVNAIGILTWAPIPFMMMSYWFLGNN
jgi:hypothetical protein